jgi:hypothetical protein
MNKICLIVFTDGRDGLLVDTLASFDRNMEGLFHYQILSDDSGDPACADVLDKYYGHRFHIIDHHPKRLGFCASIRETWKKVPADNNLIFHLEDDFLLLRKVRLDDLALVMHHNPQLMEITLLRQPLGPVERAAGGIWQCNADSYTERHLTFPDGRDLTWLEHTLALWNTNPSLYRQSLTLLSFPGPPFCEREFGFLGQHLGWHLAFWGNKKDDPILRHIGEERKGTGY